jgi:hypothetical protein
MKHDSAKFDEVVLEVVRQALGENAKSIRLDDREFPIRGTPSKGLRQVDFDFEGVTYRALEQNPNTKSRWAQLARKGAKVMQILQSGQYIAAVADGKVTHYSAK